MQINYLDAVSSVLNMMKQPDSACKNIDMHRTDTLTFEAESIAYTVCQHFGIDTSEYSFGYIAGWSSGHDMRELKSSLKAVLGQIAVLYQQKALFLLPLHQFPVTLQFPELPLNARDKFRCRPADCV